MDVDSGLEAGSVRLTKFRGFPWTDVPYHGNKYDLAKFTGYWSKTLFIHVSEAHIPIGYHIDLSSGK